MNGFSAHRAQDNRTTPHGQRFQSLAMAICLIIASFVVLLTSNIAQAATLQSGEGGSNPGVTISAPNPPQGPAGTNIIVSVSNIAAGTQISIGIGSTNGTCTNGTPINGAVGTTNSTGSAQISLTWPALAPGQYPVCAFGNGLSTQGIVSDNRFSETSQVPPTLSIPAAATGGSTVNFTGQNWTPGATVGVYISSAGGTGCDTQLTTVTADNTGLLGGTLTIPSVNVASIFLITAVNPPGTCTGSVAPTLKVTASMTVDPGAGAATATPLTGTATPGSGTGSGTATPTHGTGRSTATPATGVPTATPTSPAKSCPPLPGVFCNSVAGFPGWLLCLILLLLLALLLLLVLWLVRRRDEEVVVIEEEITNQVNANTIQPMGNLTFVRVVRVTTRIVHRPTGAIRREQVRVYEEFTDGAGNIRRRRRPA